MSVLEMLHEAKRGRTAHLRTTAIGADLIPRSALNDPHLVNADTWELISRAMNDEVRAVGLGRLRLAIDDLPDAMRARAEEIGIELGKAGMIEIGRWVTDVQLAYARVPHLAEETQVVLFHAWGIALETHFERKTA